MATSTMMLMTMSSSETEFGDGKYAEKDEALEVNRYCTRLSNKLHVLLKLKPFQVPARNAFCEREHLPRISMRVVCVIDVSHSMAEPHANNSLLSKLDEIKIFGHLLAQVSRPEDHVGIVVFGTCAEVLFPLQKMTDDAKKNLKSAFNEISLKGVTNISAGVFLAIDQFNQAYGKKSRCTNDNILLFSDGMPNEGLTNSQELTREIIKRIKHVAEECRFGQDYTIKFTTIGTSGFYPETLYHIGRLFGTGAFHHLGEDSILSSDLMLPVLNLQETVLTGIHLTVTALNGVQFEPLEAEPDQQSKYKDQFSSSAWEEYLLIKPSSSSSSSSSVRSHRAQSLSVGSNKSKMVVSRSIPLNVEAVGNIPDSQSTHSTDAENYQGEPRQHFLIHDIGIDMEKHVLLTLRLPKKHKKILKGKDILTIKIAYKDHKMTCREFEMIVNYKDLPPKESPGEEADIVATYKTVARIKACSAFDKAAGLVAKLDRNAATHVLESTIDDIRNECERLLTDTCNEENTYADLYKTIDPLLANLNRCRNYIGDYSVRWDDVWGRLKSLRSSLAREVVTSPSVYADKIQMFMTEELEEQIKEVSIVLNKLCNEMNLGKAIKRDASNRSIHQKSTRGKTIDKIDSPSCDLQEETSEGLVTQV